MELQQLAAQRAGGQLRLLGDEQPGAWHPPWGYSTQQHSWQQRYRQMGQGGEGAAGALQALRQRQPVGLRELRLELVWSCGNLSLQRIAANTNLEALSLLFCTLTYHSTALQPLSQLRSLQSANLG